MEGKKQEPRNEFIQAWASVFPAISSNLNRKIGDENINNRVESADNIGNSARPNCKSDAEFPYPRAMLIFY